jgi:20S proteasome alpha/beta subunit
VTAILAMIVETEEGNKLVYGSDTLVTRGHLKCSNRLEKFVEYDNFVALFAGSVAVSHVIHDLSKQKGKKKKFLKMQSAQDAAEYFSYITEEFNSRLNIFGAPEQDRDFSLIIATENTIYEIDKYGYVD